MELLDKRNSSHELKDADHLYDCLTLSDVVEFCQNLLALNNDNDLKVLQYRYKRTSDSPAGYLANHQYLIVDVQCKYILNSVVPVKKQLQFFVKSAPNDIISRMEYIEEFGVFKKEMSVYSDLIPRLIDYQSDFFAPKCFYAKNNLLVFENLIDLGYSMAANRDGILDFEHLNCSLKYLAKMHGASLIFENQTEQSIYKIFSMAVKENAYTTKRSGLRYQNIKNAVIALSEIIKLLPEYRKSKYHEYILEEFPKKMEDIFELVQTSVRFQNVFSHGDLWANNIMFKYKNGIPVNVRFVDFQLARYGPPMIDVLTILTIPTTSQFRKKHLNQLLDNYYKFLENELLSHNLKLASIISKKQYNESIKHFEICGLIESLLFSHLTMLPTDLTKCLTESSDGFSDFFDKHRTTICLNAFQTDDLYRERISDMLTTFINKFILKI